MARVLILFAHPALEKSRIHRRLLAAIPDGVTVNDLYEAYPTLDVDVAREQRLLEAHDVVVMQHPFFWYSTPPILKQWQDLVLEHGWAYGRGGTALQGRTLLNAVSTGGGEGAYHHQGRNRFSVRALLAPVEQTARLCGMRFLPPWVVFGAHRLEAPDIDAHAAAYGAVLTALRDDRIALDAADGFPTLNEALQAAGADSPPSAPPVP